ncbi:hypothetical protein BGY98DRAFT_527283 [Russula aff. rugulosa BPL654]|nr:hypothetical protein BGY98DRAFT_527283 [Russula aff. rugulosa BPL654]
MKVHILERILFFEIACTVVFAGLYLYTYLVSIYQSHWPHVLASHLGDGTGPTTSCISHAPSRWTPTEPSQQLDHGQSAAFQSHAPFVLPAGATGDLETSRFLLSLQDRHASGMYFAQSASAGAAAAAAVIEVKVEAFYESEEALRVETRSVCALRQSRIGVFVSGLRAVFPHAPLHMTCRFPWVLQTAAATGHEYSARDDITLKSQRVIDSPPHACAFDGQVSTPLMNAPIEVDTINTPYRYVRGKCYDVPLSLESATAAAAGSNIAAGISTYINNNNESSLVSCSQQQTAK